MIIEKNDKKNAQLSKEEKTKLKYIQQKIKIAGTQLVKKKKTELNVLLNEYVAQLYFLSLHYSWINLKSSFLNFQKLFYSVFEIP